MNKIKNSLIAALLVVASAASAQNAENDSVVALKHYKFLDNVYVGLHVGDFVSLGENVRPREFFRASLQRLGCGLTIGKNFSPALGVRVGAYVSGLVGVADRDLVLKNRERGYLGWGYYDFTQTSVFGDVVPNFTNIFNPYCENRRWNITGVFGLGFIHRFNMDIGGLMRMPDDEGWHTIVKDKDRTLFAVRAGLGVSYMLTKELDLDFEAMIHATDDKLDGFRYDDKYDGMVSFLLGVKYHFRDHYGDHRFRYRKVAPSGDLSDLNDKINQARKDLADARTRQNEIYKQQRLLDMTVSFPIDKYYITDIQERNVEAVAKYIKAHPDLKVVICGFADVETAYPEYNLRLSKRRVTSVFRMLVDKYGVDPNHLRIDYKGDTVQPYNRKNEWNRVVVFALEGVEEVEE